MKISRARRAAFDVLLRVETAGGYTSALLPSYEAELSDADRRLCHQLVLETLRRQMYLDRVIDAFAKTPPADIEVRISMRLGLLQLFFLDRIPNYAAIGESVELVRAARRSSAAAMVNAVLRRAARERPSLEYADAAERVSIETSHPRFLIDRWSELLGPEEALALARANNCAPRTGFRVLNNTSARASALIEGAESVTGVPGAFSAASASQEFQELARLGYIYPQDEASQMVAHAACAGPEGPILDVCAAPGGKTGLMATIRPSSRVFAGDLHRTRVALLRENCRRQGADVRIFQHDAERGIPLEEGSFGVVLADAPCSGTGTIRSNPEIRYRVTAESLEMLQSKQLAILQNASKLVRPGGLLVYSTCSLERVENEDVCRLFLRSVEEFSPERPHVPERFITEEGFARTWPHRDDVEGFFVAAFRRRTG